MNLLLKGVVIADPNSQFDQKVCDIRVEQGRIIAIATKLTANQAEEVFEGKGAYVSPGFMDLNCSVGDPGLETREEIGTAAAAAMAGGYTALAVLPHAQPVVDSKTQVEYLVNKAKSLAVDIYPVAAISRGLEGKELAELYDMKNAGAVAFSDGTKPIDDDGFMSRALQYAKGLDALLMVYPENKSIAGKSQINESKNSVLLGMKGLPGLAEEMHISRDIFLATYHQASVHISTVSTAGAVALIKKAKKDGVKISCDVAAHHLVFTEELLQDFDSNYKVKPPLRAAADVKALLAGLKDGTIDAVCTQHRPQEIEHKAVEFEIAAYGIIGLQTALPLMLKAGLSVAQIVEKAAIAPRKILGLPVPVVEEGEEANFVVFDPSVEWTYDQTNNKSKSSNTPLLNTVLKGKVQLVFNNKHFQHYG